MGIDFIVKAQDLQYGYIEDVSKMYKINEEQDIQIIGIFANIAQGVGIVCTLPTWIDRPPFPGEKVVVKIYKINEEK